VVITTCRHSTGFTLTQAHTMVTAIYYSNQATRDQLEGRILRLGQTAPEVFVHILHTGLLTYTKDHYEQARSLRESMEDLALKIDAKDVDPSKFM
jgi:DNA-binding ferritin-like protein